jgi:predicted NUDIX family NTP pyrophosphohydrolase
VSAQNASCSNCKLQRTIDDTSRDWILCKERPRQKNVFATMTKRSAGILLYRLSRPQPEVLLVHPGGPLWAKKDEGAWSIPKGLYEESEDPLAAAKREFAEETGLTAQGALIDLGAFRQPGGKLIQAYAMQGDADPAKLRSNLFSMEWPPKSGRMQEFPEVDRAGWFAPDVARRKLVKGQRAILDALLQRLAGRAMSAG